MAQTPGLAPVEGVEMLHEGAQFAQQIMGQTIADLDREAEHPLAHGHTGNELTG